MRLYRLYSKAALLLLYSMVLFYVVSVNANSPKIHYTRPEALPSYEAIYQVHWHKIKLGNSQHRLKRIGPKEYTFEATTTPSLTFLPFSYYEKSTFAVQQDHIWPQQYLFENFEKGRRKEGKLIFNWNKQLLYNSMKDQVENDISIATQDRLSHLLQLQLDLKNHNTLLTYPIAKPDKMSMYAFNIKDTPVIETKLGLFNTIQVEHVSSNSDRKTILWLAKDYHFVAVKLQQYRKNRLVTEASIESLKFG